MERKHFSAWRLTVFAAFLATLGGTATLVAATSEPARRSPAAAGPASVDGRLLSCGDIACETNADCPGSCGGCSEWSKTCYAF